MSTSENGMDTVIQAVFALRAMVEAGDRRGTVFAARALDDAILSAGSVNDLAFKHLIELLEQPSFSQSDGGYAVLRAVEGSTHQLTYDQKRALAPVVARMQAVSADELIRSIAWDIRRLCGDVKED